jgi:hypothetical protein
MSEATADVADAAANVRQAKAEPVESKAGPEERPEPAADTTTFRQSDDHVPARRANGIRKPNGSASAESAFEESGYDAGQPDQKADADVDQADTPSARPKPRGTKRGWWQKRTD